mmetsp:Transcript_37426/g.93900  ORF Transcript_37426/g.93900 Transcript_37426/m.93900 type:complete len:325 (-) Transcript_37426:586-1560(-)
MPSPLRCVWGVSCRGSCSVSGCFWFGCHGAEQDVPVLSIDSVCVAHARPSDDVVHCLTPSLVVAGQTKHLLDAVEKPISALRVLDDPSAVQRVGDAARTQDTVGTDVQFVLCGDLVSGNGLSVDKGWLETFVSNLITAKDPTALDYLTSIEYVAAKAFAGSLHALLRELADARDALALQQEALQAIEGVQRFVGKNLTLLLKPPMPSAVFQLAVQEPDCTALWKSASSYTQQFNPIEWLNKPKGLGPCMMRLDFDNGVMAVAFSPDGKLMASGVGKNVVVVDRITGEVKGTQGAHLLSCRHIPNANLAVSASTCDILLIRRKSD